MLGQSGAATVEVTTVQEMTEALDKATSSNRPFDVAFADYQMLGVERLVRLARTEHGCGARMLIPHVKFLNWKDERVVSTVECTMKKLTTNGFVYRYLVSDGLPGKEGAFMICTLWLVDCLVKMGKIKEGKELFEKVLHSGNHLSLFSEQIDPQDNQLLGNFPQSFTHMGIIISALTINASISSGKKSAKIT
jgi:GH15 family glucan-1,4-alpha-glucosidase